MSDKNKVTCKSVVRIQKLYSMTHHWRILRPTRSNYESTFCSPPEIVQQDSWKLSLEYCDGIFRFYLCLISSFSIEFNINFSIVKKEGNFYEKYLRNLKMKKNDRLSLFESYEIHTKKYWEDGWLQMVCTIEIPNCDSQKYLSEFSNVQGIQDIEINFSKELEALLKDPSSSDFCIKVKETKFHVHKLVLAARSPVFAAMFQHDMKENRENVIEINDFSPETIESMINYIYTGHFEDIKTKALDFLKCADKYDLKEIKTRCEDTLCKIIKTDNVIDMLFTADLYNLEKLAIAAIDFMKFHLNDVIQSPNFLNLTQSPSCVAKILKSYALDYI